MPVLDLFSENVYLLISIKCHILLACLSGNIDDRLNRYLLPLLNLLLMFLLRFSVYMRFLRNLQFNASIKIKS
jgi:hypothetical protein